MNKKPTADIFLATTKDLNLKKPPKHIYSALSSKIRPITVWLQIQFTKKFFDLKAIGTSYMFQSSAYLAASSIVSIYAAKNYQLYFDALPTL